MSGPKSKSGEKKIADADAAATTNNNNKKINRKDANTEAPEVVLIVSSSSDELEEGPKSSNNSNDETLDDDHHHHHQRKYRNSVSNNGVGGSCCFPANRIRKIIRSEGADFRTTQETMFLINKATEQFLEMFAEDAHVLAQKDHQKAVSYEHLSSVVCKGRRYDFLSDFVPEKVRAEDALLERLAET